MSQERTRVYSLDLARGLAVFYMVLVHVLITYSNPMVQGSVFGAIVEFLGGSPAAPVFMALMGVSFYYSRNKEFFSGVQRGFKIIFLGYVLNLFRGVLPVLVVSKLAPSSGAHIPAAVANCRDALLELDILQFAGLSLIVMAVIRELKVNRYVLLFLAAVIALVSPSLWGIGSNIPVAGHFLDYLWGDKPSSEACIGNLVSFPFFPWFTFVLLGMFLGDVLTRTEDVGKTFKKIGIAGFAMFGMSLVAIVPDYRHHLGDYYHSRPVAVAFEAGIVLLCLYLCQLAIEKVPMNKAFKVLFLWSKDVNRVYLIQWVLIMWGACAVTGFNKNSYTATVGIMLFMLAATHFLNGFYPRVKEVLTERKTLRVRTKSF